MKLGRNDPCWCKSGKKYKFCHWASDRDRIVKIDPALHPPGTPAEVNFKDDISNAMAGFTDPISQFCKENDFYLFKSSITIGDLENLRDRLDQGTLTKHDIIEANMRFARRQFIRETLIDACQSFPAFKDRDRFLLDAVDAHFDGKYTLSVPTLFAQIEGVLRQIGALVPSDNFRPTIKRDVWDNRLLFEVGDSAKTFNAFIAKLYEGQKNDTFNRNPVLHGASLSYDTEEYSLILILSILEIRTFLWLEANTTNIV